MNNKNSDFIKKYNIQTIPRYMIIDKKGDLIYPEAPRVEDPATAELLKNLAAK